jgi:hypothetical protein
MSNEEKKKFWEGKKLLRKLLKNQYKMLVQGTDAMRAARLNNEALFCS